jgi:hypothetical protein
MTEKEENGCAGEEDEDKSMMVFITEGNEHRCPGTRHRAPSGVLGDVVIFYFLAMADDDDDDDDMPALVHPVWYDGNGKEEVVDAETYFLDPDAPLTLDRPMIPLRRVFLAYFDHEREDVYFILP